MKFYCDNCDNELKVGIIIRRTDLYCENCGSYTNIYRNRYGKKWWIIPFIGTAITPNIVYFYIKPFIQNIAKGAIHIALLSLVTLLIYCIALSLITRIILTVLQNHKRNRLKTKGNRNK